MKFIYLSSLILCTVANLYAMTRMTRQVIPNYLKQGYKSLYSQPTGIYNPVSQPYYPQLNKPITRFYSQLNKQNPDPISKKNIYTEPTKSRADIKDLQKQGWKMDNLYKYYDYIMHENTISEEEDTLEIDQNKRSIAFLSYFKSLLSNVQEDSSIEHIIDNAIKHRPDIYQNVHNIQLFKEVVIHELGHAIVALLLADNTSSEQNHL